MDLKDLMKQDIDVGELYTKVADLAQALSEVNELEAKLLVQEEEIRKLLEPVKKDPSFSELRIDLLNGTFLVMDDDAMWMEAAGDD